MTETFVLRSTLTSPFGRKVRIAIEKLNLGGRITLQPADTLDDNDTLRQQNPLGKMPVLLLTDGTAIYDSGVIIEFLADLAGDATLIPPKGRARFETLTRARLADGITEAAILMVYEGRFREPAQKSERWMSHQGGKIERALTAFEGALPDPARTSLVSIGLACALGYLDWRKPVNWRGGHPRIAQWLTDFAANEPLYERTRAPD